jgi:uncharacterized protein (DUF983 family)
MYGYSIPAKPVNPAVNCTYVQDINQTKCYNDGGQPRFVQDNNGCEVYDKCDYCSRDFNDAQQSYNRNIFFILMPIGLVIVIIGIYLTVEYIGAALMFAGLITMFYATIRYFSNMSKILRALVILVELLIIMWIGYKKIGEKDSKDAKVTVNKKRR